MKLSRFVIALFFVVGIASWQQIRFNPNRQNAFYKIAPSPVGYTVGTSKGDHFHWTVEPWNGSERPFIMVRRQIENEIKLKFKRSDILVKYRQIAKIRPTDAVAQFGWAYAAYRNYSKPDKGQKQVWITAGVREALEAPISPRSHEYARMRWFFTWWDFKIQRMAPRILKQCAVRLLKHSSNDIELKYTLAHDYSHYKETNAKAMQWAREYARIYPTRPESDFLLGQVHESRFGYWCSYRDALKAKGYFQKYIESSDIIPEQEKSARSHINYINFAIESFRGSGQLKY
jgi:hypothetical protein